MSIRSAGYPLPPTPLERKILAGHADQELLDHVNTLEGFDRLSERELRTLYLCYERLDYLTKPEA